MQVIPHDTELGTTIFQKIEEGMYQVDFVKSMTHILVFLVLFIYTIKFFYVYLIRLFVVLILIMIAPLMGITYAIDRINGNKTSRHLTTWINEFSINVLIQFVITEILSFQQPNSDLLKKRLKSFFIVSFNVENFVENV